LFHDLSAPPLVEVCTEADGEAVAVCRPGCTWYSGPFFREYRCLTYSEGLRVEAPGYQSVDSLLQDYTKYPDHHNTSTPPPILVRLKRATGINPSS
jgi:hypothetical protein